MFQLFLLSLSFHLAAGHSWGLDQCIGPMHGPLGSKPGPLPEGFHISFKDSSSLEISSETPIRGFLIYGPISFENAPTHTEISGICGHASGSISHTNAYPRNNISVKYTCPEGESSVDIRAYIVFGVSQNHSKFRARVPCVTTTYVGEDSSTTPSV